MARKSLKPPRGRAINTGPQIGTQSRKSALKGAVKPSRRTK